MTIAESDLFVLACSNFARTGSCGNLWSLPIVIVFVFLPFFYLLSIVKKVAEAKIKEREGGKVGRKIAILFRFSSSQLQGE
jgi:hypothetical protein